MRKKFLSAAIVLALFVLAPVPAWPDTATIHPSQPGHLFVVINYVRAQGRTQATRVTFTRGTTSKTKTISPPYRRCRDTFPAGFILKMRIQTARLGIPHTFSTVGTIVRPPYIGELPPEIAHPCYDLVLF